MNSFEESIAAIENGLKYLKKQHSMYTSSSIDAAQYEINCEDCLSKIDDALLVVRHTYLPLTIPKFLKLPENPPEWLNLKQKEIDEYKNFAKNSEMLQERLLRKFRRPGLRKSNIEKAVKLLTIEQHKLYNSELWKVYQNFAEQLKVSSRVNIPVASKAPKEVVDAIESAFQEADIEATTLDNIGVILAIVFSEDGALENGLKGGLQKDASVIAAAAAKVFTNFDKNELLGIILPYVAKIYEDEIIKDAKTICPKFIKKFDEASAMFGENISVSDFAEEGELPEKIKDALLDCLFFESVDELIVKLNNAGKDVIRASKSYRQARAILGSALISIQDPRIISLFFAGIRWCAPSTLNEFTMCPLYLMTFEEITTIVPDI